MRTVEVTFNGSRYSPGYNDDGPVVEQMSDGRYYCCIGAAGGYGLTENQAISEATRRVRAARRLFG